MKKDPKLLMPEIETFDMRQSVSGMLPDDWREWPAQMREALEGSLERTNGLRAMEGKPRLVIARSRCAKDEQGWYVHVIAQPHMYVEKPAPDRCSICGKRHPAGMCLQ